MFVLLRRDAYLLLASRAVRTFPFGYLSVIIPIYLASTHSALLLGSFFSISILSSMGLLLFLSLLGHKTGIRWLLILQMLALSITLVIMAFTALPILLLVAAAISVTNWAPGGGSGTGSGPYNTTITLLLAQKSDLDSRTLVFVASAIIGSITFAAGAYFLSVAKLASFSTPQSLFAFAAILQVVAVLIALTVSGSSITAMDGPKSGLESSFVSIIKTVKSFVTAEFLNGLGQGVFQRLIPLWFFLRFGIGAETIGGITALGGVITTLLVVFAPALETRFGSAESVFAGRILYAVLVVSMSLSPLLSLSTLLYYLSLFSLRVAAPIQQSLVFARIDASNWTRASGVIAIGYSIGSSIGPLIGAILILDVNQAFPFLAGAPFLVASALIYQVNFARRRRYESEKTSLAKNP